MASKRKGLIPKAFSGSTSLEEDESTSMGLAGLPGGEGLVHCLVPARGTSKTTERERARRGVHTRTGRGADESEEEADSPPLGRVVGLVRAFLIL